MKKWLCRLTLPGVALAAFFGNFEKHWHGYDPAEIWNFLLTALYLGAWGWFLWEKRSKPGLWLACIWWGLSLLGTVSWLGLQYLSFPEIFLFAAWPGTLCLSQLFGLNFLFRLPYGGLYLVFLAVCITMLGWSVRKKKLLDGM